MRVLHIVDSMEPAGGGPAQGIRNIIPQMMLHGTRNEVVTLDCPSMSVNKGDPFPIATLGPACSPWRFSQKLYPQILAKLDYVDVVFTHGLWLYSSYASHRAVRKARCKWVGSKRATKHYVFPHGMLDPYFQTAPERRFKSIRNWFYWHLVESRVINSADGVLFTCERERILARTTFANYHPRREFNVGYGVAAPPQSNDTMRQAFLSTCPELLDQGYLLFLSRIHPKKGVDLLIKAYAQIMRSPSMEQQDIPALVIAGPADSNYALAMKRLAADLGLTANRLVHLKQPRVYFPGMLQGDSKWGAFYGCEAFVLPSYQENFGIAVAEALACGKPTLISDQVNICEEIKTSGAGMVEECSLKGTLRLIQNWQTASFEVRKKMGQNARSCYERNFEMQTMMKKLLNIMHIMPIVT